MLVLCSFPPTVGFCATFPPSLGFSPVLLYFYTANHIMLRIIIISFKLLDGKFLSVNDEANQEGKSSNIMQNSPWGMCHDISADASFASTTSTTSTTSATSTTSDTTSTVTTISPDGMRPDISASAW